MRMQAYQPFEGGALGESSMVRSLKRGGLVVAGSMKRGSFSLVSLGSLLAILNLGVTILLKPVGKETMG
jgi:hypothetical protein